MQLSRRQDAALDQHDVMISATGKNTSIDSDLSALLLAADGKVRGEAGRTAFVPSVAETKIAGTEITKSVAAHIVNVRDRDIGRSDICPPATTDADQQVNLTAEPFVQKNFSISRSRGVRRRALTASAGPCTSPMTSAI